MLGIFAHFALVQFQPKHGVDLSAIEQQPNLCNKNQIPITIIRY